MLLKITFGSTSPQILLLFSRWRCNICSIKSIASGSEKGEALRGGVKLRLMRVRARVQPLPGTQRMRGIITFLAKRAQQLPALWLLAVSLTALPRMALAQMNMSGPHDGNRRMRRLPANCRRRGR